MACSRRLLSCFLHYQIYKMYLLLQQGLRVRALSSSVLRCVCAGTRGRVASYDQHHHCCAASAQEQTPLSKQRAGFKPKTVPVDSQCGGSSCGWFGGRVMRSQGWIPLCRSLWCTSRRQAAVACSSKNARLVRQSGPIMAEEAKKLAAYAAVDNHVQVPSFHRIAAVFRHF